MRTTKLFTLKFLRACSRLIAARFTACLRTRTSLAALLCATTAWAADYSVGTNSELRAAIQNDGANITVTADIGLSNSTLSIESGKTITINLNGHMLDRKLNERGKGGGQVITVRKNATLNLSNGTLKGGWGGDSGGINNEGGTVNLTDVTITGCTGDDRGGGISNRAGGTLKMTGGAITGNTSYDRTDPAGGGGLFNYDGATATLTGVTITGNASKLYGGGGICNYGTLSLNGCIIRNNTARTSGGGIWSGNQRLNMKMQGANIITDNVAGGITSNLFMLERRLITCTGSIAGSRIGVTLDVVPNTFTKDFAKYHSGDDYAAIFFCDRPEINSLELINETYSTPGEVKVVSNVPEGAVPYIEYSWDSVNKKVVSTIKMLTEEIPFNATPTSETQYKRLPSNDDSYLDIGTVSYELHEYYVVSGEEVNINIINVLGPNVHIILCDHAWLHLQQMIDVGEGATVYLHAQSSGSSMGKITNDELRFSGGGIGGYAGGNIEIHGGGYDLRGNADCAAIGCTFDKSGDITIYDGRIKAVGGWTAAGIGGGAWCKDYGNITIYDGTIDATGGPVSDTEYCGGAGIGGGSEGEKGNLTIWGGTITARGDHEAAGIGSAQWGGTDGAGHITINGGTIKAYGDDYGAGIGGGDSKNGGTITINGGRVEAYGGTDAAGIGGGEDGDGGTVTITGGYVYAQGGWEYGAGIGGGQDGKGAKVTITGGIVIAKAGMNDTGCRAIGPGGGSDDYGSLTLGDNMMVSSERKFRAEERVPGCWYRTQVRVEPCDHQDATASVNDGSTHSVDCNYCKTDSATHTFGDDSQCDACKLIRLEDEGDNSALFTKWADGNAHDFFLSGRKLAANSQIINGEIVQSSRAYTVCLPFDMDITDRKDDLTLWILSYIKDGSEMVFTRVLENKVEAGKPYLIVIHKGELELLGNSPLTVTPDEGVRVYDWDNREQPLGWWRGTLTKIESADAAAVMAYALQSVGDFRRIRPDTYWAWWGAFRSMYCPDDLPGTNRFTINRGALGGFGSTIVFEGDTEIDDDVVGITTTNFTNDTNFDAWYNLNGRRLDGKPSRAGVYINNGKKVVIK